MADVDPIRQRAKLLYLMDILQKYTGEDESLTRVQIEQLLAEQGISEGRKAFAEDIEALEAFGADIIRTNGRTASYSLGSRDFELAELKLIADVVSSAKILSEEQAKTLLKKLSGLCSLREAKQLDRTVYVSGRPEYKGKLKPLYNVDVIQRALTEEPRCKISFNYFEYDINKRKKYRDKARVVTPYALVWENDHYYLVAWNDHRDCYSNFRVDRMEEVRMTDLPARKKDADFDLGRYTTTHISMFSGDETEVKLHCRKDLMNNVLDRFGASVRVIPDKDGEGFCVFPAVVARSPFYAWVFQFGGGVEILSPENVRQEYEDMLRGALSGLGNAAD